MSKKLKLVFFSTFALLLFINQSMSGQAKRHVDVGVEVQQYPTGFLLGLRGEIIFKEHHGIDFRLGLNKFDHKDFGVQDNEEGVGFGGSLGYNLYFKERQRGIFVGPRIDVWRNKVNWSMDKVGPDVVAGTTRILVIQPTVVIGYSIFLGENLLLAPKLAAGMEINAITKGAKVGEGPILLWGLSLSSRLTANKNTED